MNADARKLLRGLLLLAFVLLGRAAFAQPVTVTDIAGRTVTLPAPAKRIVLAQGRQLNALGLIHPDPVAVLAGWGSDYRRQNPDGYDAYRKRFPAIEAVPMVGDGATPAGFSLEQAIALAPDLVVLSRSVITRSDAGDAIVARLEAAGIPVLVADFFLEPLRDTVPSLRVLGRAIGQEARAEALIRFYEERKARIAQRLAGVERPAIFMHAHAGGYQCCPSPGKGTFNELIVAAGGRNIAAEIVPGTTGQISVEELLKADPAVYVATGGTHLAKLGGLVLGLSVPRERALASFAMVLETPGLAELSAVKRGRAHAMWHLFNDTPLHVVAIELLAKWLHPALFADIDPAATLAELSTRFSAIPLEGTFWLDAPPPAKPKP